MTEPYLGPDTGEDQGPNTDVDYNKIICFPEPPDTAPFKDDNQLNDTLYYLRSEYRYTTLGGLVICIPADFHTDELSAPRCAWTIIGTPPDGYYRAAAVVHDYIYGLQGKLPLTTLTRAQCDDILLEILNRLGMAGWRSKAVYLAVRLFGGSHWNK